MRKYSMKRYSMKKRFLSMMLCVAMALSVVPPIQTQAAITDVGVVKEKARLAYGNTTGGLSYVPSGLSDNKAFMDAYVYNSNRLNLNSSFKLAQYDNLKNKNGTMPTGSIESKKAGFWYASYKWNPTEAELNFIKNGTFIVETKLISDYHSHGLGWFKPKTWHWSVIGLRLSRANAEGNNSWTYKTNDYGYRPNGDNIVNEMSAEKKDEQPQKVTLYGLADKINGPVYLNFYQLWDHDCGDARAEGTVAYVIGGTNPRVVGSSSTAGSYQKLVDNAEYSITLNFDTKIRFADNQAHDAKDIYLNLDAEYLPQSGKNGGFTIKADLTGMTENSLTFTYKVDKEWKHFKITGASSEQPGINQETALKVYDAKGEPLDAVSLTSNTLFSDYSGAAMSTFNGYDFPDIIYDGVGPKLNKVDITGTGITTNAAEPSSWKDNSGSNADAAVGEKFTFRTYFSEDVKLENQNNARAVMSITDGSQNPIKLKVSKVSGNCVTFEELTITADMQKSGNRVVIQKFENFNVTDMAGNSLPTGALTGSAIVPAQEIYLDVAAPYIESAQTVKPHVISECFSYPVVFYEDKGSGNEKGYSGIDGKSVKFRLEMQDGDKYPYKWYVDTTEAIGKNLDDDGWKIGTTGVDNVIEDISDGTQYWVHIALDKSLDYNYTDVGGMDDDGIYFNGNLVFSGLSDWAGNVGASVTYPITKHQVDLEKPITEITAGVAMVPNPANYSATFDIPISVKDNYCIKTVFYQWEVAVGDGAFTPVSDFVTISGDALGTGLVRDVTVNAASYTYSFNPSVEAQRYGKVRLKAYCVDRRGLVSDVVTSREISFNFRKAINNSTVKVNSAMNAVRIPEYNLEAPALDGDTVTANTPVSLLIIPDANSKDAGGNYTQFWVVAPSEGTYYDNALTKYIDWYEDGYGFLDYVEATVYHVNGSVNIATGEGNFDEATMLRLDQSYLNYARVEEGASEEEKAESERLRAELKAQQDAFYNYLTQYYGVMELYTVATSSIANHRDSMDFAQADSVLDTFRVYVRNATEYSFSDVVIRNAAGQTDAQVGDSEVKLDYVGGEGRPAATNLDNVSVAVKVNNVTDPNAMGGVNYGLEYLNYDAGNAAFKLFYTNRTKYTADYDNMVRWYDPIKTWDLVKSADGINTITFDPGLCTENGWYTLTLEVNDRVTGDKKLEFLGNFFVDNSTLDISMDSMEKSLHLEDEYGRNAFEWTLDEVESKYEAGEELHMGLAPLPEGWEEGDVYSENLPFISFSTTKRANGSNDYAYGVVDNLAKVRIYNQTFNALAELEKDAGLWMDHGSTISTKEYKYHPYLADPAMGTEAYGTADAPQMPMVAGGNLLVYEIMADNGVVSKKEIVIYVETELDSKWDLTYEVTYGENSIPTNVKVWPISAVDGMAMTGLNTGNASYDQTKYNFRLQEGYPHNFVESYDYDEENVENFAYYLIDPYGNISVKTLTATDEEGNVLQIDSRAPEFADQNTRYNNADENHDAAYGLKTDMYRNGDTFHFYIYTYDYDNWIDIQDVYLLFDAEYSKLLGGGERDEEGRLIMQVPVAVDENGEPLKNADGTYAVWESTDPMYNGIYRTQVRQYGPDMTHEHQKDYGGYVAIDVWGTWKYEDNEDSSESPIGTTRTIGVFAEDIAGNRLDPGSSYAMKYQYNPSCVTMGYPLEVGRLAQTDEGVKLIRSNEEGSPYPYSDSVLNDDGTVGFYSTVPFQSISGYGVEEALELDNYHEGYSYYDRYFAPDNSWQGYYAPEGRYYYYNAPMITQDSKVISEDEDGNKEYEPYYFDVVDLFGQRYQLPLYVINQYGELGVDVTFSTTLPTNQSVTVYATATGIDEEIESIVAEDGTVGVIDPMDPTAASITVEENCVITIKTKPVNPGDEGSVRKVKVSNIDKTLEPARVLLYDQNYDLLDVSMGATEVTAVLACDETVFATNGGETYEFPAGSVAGTTYTFEYRDIAGNTGSITATLPIDLSTPDVPEVVVDNESPDVDAGIYAYRKGAYDLLERVTNPDLSADSNESELTAQMSSDENSMFKAQKFRVALNIRDESNYKILVTAPEEEAPMSYEDVESGCTVENVTMSTGISSASLEVTENTAFTIHVIDEYNNVNSIENVNIIRVDKTAPELTPEYVASRDEEDCPMITATFHPSEEDKLEDIFAITADVPSTLVNVAGEGEDPVYALRYYHVFKENGRFSFTYEDGAGNTDQASAEVKGMSTEAAAITSTSWFGTKDRDGKHNVTPDKSVNVSRDISVQLRMDKAISQVELFEYNSGMEGGFGAQLDENSPVQASVTGSTVVITYTENMDSKVLVRFTASESGRKSTTILPAITCIDKLVPAVTLVGTDVAEDKQSMTLRFETDEKTVFAQNIDEGKVGFGKTHEWTTKDDKPMTLYFTDEAGNQAQYEVTDFAGLDLVQLEALYSASRDGSNPTKDPVNALALFGNETFYVKVNKEAVGSLNNGNEFQITANTWTPITLPDKVGFHILKLVDRNIGKTIQELVCVLPKDNVAPAVELATSTIFVYENASMGEMMEAIHQGITVTDNMDPAPTYTVAGIPTSAAESGLYTLYYTAKDNKGNESVVQRVLYIMDKDTPILWINDEVGLPYNKVFVKAGKINLTLQNIGEEQPVMIKYSKGLYTTGQMKYNGIIVRDMSFDATETGHYTIHVRNQDRTEFVTYIYVEG